MKTSLLLITICGFILVGCCTPRRVTQWEYRQTSTLAEVNQLALEGWTIVNFAVPQSGPYVYLLRRPKL